MKIADAEREIFRVWRDWNEPQDKYGNHFGLFFYGWLEQNAADLLSFSCPGDKYQEINAWVMGWQSKHPKEKP